MMLTVHPNSSSPMSSLNLPTLSETANSENSISTSPSASTADILNSIIIHVVTAAAPAVNKEIWVNKRQAEVSDTSYFHVVFTIPYALNSLILL